MAADPLLTHDGELVPGTVVDRPNRFVLRVAFDGEPERAFLGDPGALAMVEPGSTVLCSPVDDPERKTDHDAIAVAVGDRYVSLRAALANDLFAAVLERDLLPEFRPYEAVEREPALPDHGRTDFRLDGAADAPPAYVEVKSCTHAEGGVAMFPDRPTERGRRHLRSLADLAADGDDCHLVFVVQRADVTAFRPFREVDPAFADRLADVRDRGVGLRVVATAFDPPHYYLRETDLPVEGLD